VHGKYFIIIFLGQRVYKIFVQQATLVLRLLLNFIAHQFVYVPQLFLIDIGFLIGTNILNILQKKLLKIMALGQDKYFQVSNIKTSEYTTT